MSKEIKINGVTFESKPGILEKISQMKDSRYPGLMVASGPKSQLQISDRYLSGDTAGKTYPGRLNFFTMRTIARGSSVVKSIVELRSQQVAKLPIRIIPKKKETSRQIDILKYSVYDIDNHPAFDDTDKIFLRDVYERLDPTDNITDKRQKYREMKEKFSPDEQSYLAHLKVKHDKFYRKRSEDIAAIEKVLNEPDPWFTNCKSWNGFALRILDDLLVLDRGIFVKLRDTNDKLRGLMPIDGATIKPVLNERGFMDDDKAYVQEVNGDVRHYLRKEDVVVVMMHPKTETHVFGYGESPLETLYNLVLTDMFIDKSNLDFYRKGGTIPEGILSIEPPTNKEGMMMQVDQRQLETMQRQLQSIMMGDYTQIPLLSGGKVSWIDFKGKRRDMQFQELAEYVAKKICSVYQVSSQEINLLEGFKTSDGDTQAELTKSKGLRTLMTILSEFITTEVIREIRPEDDLKLWFEEDDIQRRDSAWKITQGQLTVNYLSINEARALEGLAPVPWGDAPMQGLKTWKPEEDGQQAPGLPPLPGIPGMGAGMPPAPAGNPMPPVMKAFERAEEARLFEMQEYADVDFSAPTKLYSKSYESLQNFEEYRGGEFARNPLESFKYFVKSFTPSTVLIESSSGHSSDEFVLPSSYSDGVVYVGSEFAEVPLITAISKSIIDKTPALQEIDEEIRVEAVERAILSRLDTPTRKSLDTFIYNQKPLKATVYQVQQAEEIIYGKV